MLAPLLLLLAATGQTGTIADEPQFSSITLTECIGGGLVGPILWRRIEIGFDWNAREYRVTVSGASSRASAEVSYSTAELGRERFEQMIRGVREGGLLMLPPQPDPAGPDVYGMNTSLEFCDGSTTWQNLVSGGCIINRAEVLPTEDERQAFARILKGILDTVEEIDLVPGCELDAGFPFRPKDEREARAFLEALKHVMQEPYAALVDRNRVDVLPVGPHYEIRFAWRALQDLQFSPSRMRRRDSCDVLIDRETLSVVEVRVRPFEPSPETLAGRREFLESQPNLSLRHRRLITAGWVAPGMTEEMVTAAWGEPSSARVYERHGKRVQVRSHDGVVVAVSAN